MEIVIKPMETDEEKRGKAFVHWKAWHEAYPGLVSQDYLDNLTLERCEKMAFSWSDGILVAKDFGRVIGFVGYGDRGAENPDTGEIFALYVLSEYYGTGVGRKLMEAGLQRLKPYPKVCLWVLKENARAIRFYRKCGFVPDGEEMVSPRIAASEIRMILADIPRSTADREPMIRRLRPEDAADVSAMIVRTLRAVAVRDYTKEYVEDLILRYQPDDVLRRAEDAHFYVLWRGEEIVGSGAVGPCRGSKDEVCLYAVFVVPQLEGTGLGRRIMDALEQDELTRRAKRIEVPSSLTAVPFYLKLGYRYKDGVTEPDENLVIHLEKRLVT